MKQGILIYLILVMSPAFAGGPLTVVGNQPVKYAGNVSLNFETGPLGGRSNAVADALVNDGLALWNNVNTSTMSISQSADLAAGDIDVSNYTSVITTRLINDPASSDGLNPVVYDHDGQIIDDIFGAGASNDVAGFAVSLRDGASLNYGEGFVVLNGAMSLTDDDIRILVAHEVGHFIGLDHSQGDQKQICSSPPANYPLMYPYICRNTADLTPDDEMAVTALYPVANVDTLLGKLTGRLYDKGLLPLLGANVWVENTGTGEVYSVVSDYLLQRNGFFQLYLPAGTYRVHAQSINTTFNGASSVGPYADTILSDSFTDPHPIPDSDYQGDTEGSIELVTINTGVTQDIDFRLYEVHSNSFPTGVPNLAVGKRRGMFAPGFLAILILLFFRRRAPR